MERKVLIPLHLSRLLQTQVAASSVLPPSEALQVPPWICRLLGAKPYWERRVLHRNLSSAGIRCQILLPSHFEAPLLSTCTIRHRFCPPHGPQPCLPPWEFIKQLLQAGHASAAQNRGGFEQEKATQQPRKQPPASSIPSPPPICSFLSWPLAFLCLLFGFCLSPTTWHRSDKANWGRDAAKSGDTRREEQGGAGAEAGCPGISIVGARPRLCHWVPLGTGSALGKATPPRFLQSQPQAGPPTPGVSNLHPTAGTDVIFARVTVNCVQESAVLAG